MAQQSNTYILSKENNRDTEHMKKGKHQRIVYLMKVSPLAESYIVAIMTIPLLFLKDSQQIQWPDDQNTYLSETTKAYHIQEESKA